MSELALQNIIEGGTTPTFSNASAGGDTAKVPKPYATFIQVKNTDAVEVNVTIKGVISSNQKKLNDQLIVVPITTGDKLIPIRSWEVDAALDVTIEYDSVTAATVAVIQIGS